MLDGACDVQAWRLLDALLGNQPEETAGDAPSLEQAATAVVVGDGSSGGGSGSGADGGSGSGGNATGDGFSPA